MLIILVLQVSKLTFALNTKKKNLYPKRTFREMEETKLKECKHLHVDPDKSSLKLYLNAN